MNLCKSCCYSKWSTLLILRILYHNKEPKDEDEGLCEYEKQRLKKIKENRAFLASLNIGSAKEELKSTIKKPAPKV